MKKKIRGGKSKERPTKLKTARKASKGTRPKKRLKVKAKRQKRNPAPIIRKKRAPKRLATSFRGGLAKRRKARVSKDKKLARRLVSLKTGVKRARVRLDKVEKAIDIIGESKLKKGRVLLEGTNWTRPDKKGFRNIHDLAKKATRKQKRGAVYSFDLHVSLYDRQGRPVTKVIKGAGLPKASSIKRRLKDNGRMESIAEAFERKLRRLVTSKVFEVFAEFFPYPEKLRKAKIADKDIRSLIRKIHEKRDTKIQFILYRETFK